MMCGPTPAEAEQAEGQTGLKIVTNENMPSGGPALAIDSSQFSLTQDYVGNDFDEDDF